VDSLARLNSATLPCGGHAIKQPPSCNVHYLDYYFLFNAHTLFPVNIERLPIACKNLAETARASAFSHSAQRLPRKLVVCVCVPFCVSIWEQVPPNALARTNPRSRPGRRQSQPSLQIPRHSPWQRMLPLQPQHKKLAMPAVACQNLLAQLSLQVALPSRQTSRAQLLKPVLPDGPLREDLRARRQKQQHPSRGGGVRVGDGAKKPPVAGEMMQTASRREGQPPPQMGRGGESGQAAREPLPGFSWAQCWWSSPRTPVNFQRRHWCLTLPSCPT